MKSNKMASSKHVKQGKYDAILLLGRGAYFAGTIDTWTRGAYWNTKRWKRYISHRVYFTHLYWRETKMEKVKTDGSTHDVNICLRHRWSSQI